MIKVVGIDPGIASTGIAIVQKTPASKYKLVSATLVKTHPRHPEAERLLAIVEAVEHLWRQHSPNVMSVERVFHNKNVSSSITTGAVIGAVSIIAARDGKPVIYPTPQQVKASCGLGGRAGKDRVQRSMCRLFGSESLRNPHVADAAAAAIAAILQAGGSR